MPLERIRQLKSSLEELDIFDPEVDEKVDSVIEQATSTDQEIERFLGGDKRMSPTEFNSWQMDIMAKRVGTPKQMELLRVS